MPTAVGYTSPEAGPNPASVAPTLPVPSPTEQTKSADWLHPYTLEGLREHTFKSAPLKGREETLKTPIFTRYAITYESDGLLITGTMQIPAQGEPPFPVILMNHGYFNRTEYHSGDGTDRAAEYLNRHGYLTLSSDYRSWGGSEVGPSLYYSGLVIDVVNLIMAVDDIPEADELVDPRRDRSLGDAQAIGNLGDRRFPEFMDGIDVAELVDRQPGHPRADAQFRLQPLEGEVQGVDELDQGFLHTLPLVSLAN